MAKQSSSKPVDKPTSDSVPDEATPQTSETEGPAVKKARVHFKADRQKKFKWLQCESVDGVETMFCSLCARSGIKNGFTRGSTNMRASALTEHSQCQDHTFAVNAGQQQMAMKSHIDSAKEQSSQKLHSQLKVVFHMAKNDIPGNQFRGMTDLLRAVGVPDFGTDDGIYKHSESLCDMERALEGDEQLGEQLDDNLKASEFIGIIIDETVHYPSDPLQPGPIYFMVPRKCGLFGVCCEGVPQQQFRHTPVSCLKDISQAVRSSTVTGVNSPQLVGNESGETFVKTDDWHNFLVPSFRPLPGIKRYHHLRFTSAEPGVVYAKEFEGKEEESFMLLRTGCFTDQEARPTELTPPGLDGKGQWYLFEKIREFCTEETKDTCPKPLTAHP
ncbi:hypothetical protein KUCAC02_002296 [Chaenocephalus aceratus]|uniref:Uncharacterized protein n=1 Tax=Chaenocephalus aceratus TaxID=36190 RepID=A0ACB9XT51_CHAAC|nr:hypothetical protein KUCAC02_002296 [Chaenocephalus aceratus]